MIAKPSHSLEDLAQALIIANVVTDEIGLAHPNTPSVRGVSARETLSSPARLHALYQLRDLSGSRSNGQQ
jgi:hypothetical protein